MRVSEPDCDVSVPRAPAYAPVPPVTATVTGPLAPIRATPAAVIVPFASV